MSDSEDNGDNSDRLKTHIVPLLFMGVLAVSQCRSADTALQWAGIFAHHIAYFLTINGLQEVFSLVLVHRQQLSLFKVWDENKTNICLYAAVLAVVLMTKHRILDDDFLLVYAAYSVCQCLEKIKRPSLTISYGTGMACSFYEGYLKLVIPSDGAQQASFVDKIRDWESSQHVVFPVKKLLLVITATLYCPPDLREFNNPDREDLPQIEACEGLEEVERDVAGVKKRRYRNTAYKIYWPDNSHPPLYLMAECATPLHTLYGVLHNHTLYRELARVDSSQLVSDFCSQLQKILSRSPACVGKCDLVHFDNREGSGEYLPLVLAETIARLEPDYRNIIARHAALYRPPSPPDDEDIPLDNPPIILHPRIHNDQWEDSESNASSEQPMSDAQGNVMPNHVPIGARGHVST